MDPGCHIVYMPYVTILVRLNDVYLYYQTKRNEETEMGLYFSKPNLKLIELQIETGLRVMSFDLPAGETCPAASLCKSFIDKLTGKIVDEGVFRCYAVMAEAQYKSVKASRANNFAHVKAFGITACDIPVKADIIRIHSSGDFFSEKYFVQWLEIAALFPDKIFFGYTKMAPFLIKYAGSMPQNFRMVYSHGGVFDDMAAAANLPTCYVWTGGDLLAPLVCEDKKNDDFEYIMEGKSFSLRVHGTQPAGFKKPGESPAKPGNV